MRSRVPGSKFPVDVLGDSIVCYFFAECKIILDINCTLFITLNQEH